MSLRSEERWVTGVYNRGAYWGKVLRRSLVTLHDSRRHGKTAYSVAWPKWTMATTTTVARPRHRCKWVRWGRLDPLPLRSFHVRGDNLPELSTNHSSRCGSRRGFTGGEIHWISDLLQVTVPWKLPSVCLTEQVKLEGIVFKFLCDNPLIYLYQSCFPNNQLQLCYRVLIRYSLIHTQFDLQVHQNTLSVEFQYLMWLTAQL
jgi:hypothetical protein